MSQEIVQSDGEIVTLPNPGSSVSGFGQGELARQTAERTGGVGRNLECTYDVSTEEGKETCMRHIQHNPDKNAKSNDGWYGKHFDLVAVTSRSVRVTKDPDGKQYSEPRVLTRTVMEAADGSLLVSSSDYVYESLLTIMAMAGVPSRDRPIRVYLGKGGNADKMFMAPKAANASPPPKQPKQVAAK